jgi:hypothetical protein
MTNVIKTIRILKTLFYFMNIFMVILQEALAHPIKPVGPVLWLN